MQFLWMSLFALGIAAADQITKYLVVANIPLYGSVEVIPGIVSLTYVQNTGAAFSMFQGMQWLFMLIFAALTVVLLWEYFKKPMPLTRLERWTIAAIYGGGLGNLIDRVRQGFVVDMVKTEFINFPIFNLADCFITCGCFFLIVHMFFFNKNLSKDEKQ